MNDFWLMLVFCSLHVCVCDVGVLLFCVGFRIVGFSVVFGCEFDIRRDFMVCVYVCSF